VFAATIHSSLLLHESSANGSLQCGAQSTDICTPGGTLCSRSIRDVYVNVKILALRLQHRERVGLLIPRLNPSTAFDAHRINRGNSDSVDT